MTDKKKIRYKEVAVAVCLFMLFGLFSACESGTDTILSPEDTGAPKALVLPLYAGEEFNPYGAVSEQNKKVLSLCYCGLFAVDGSWTAVPLLARDYQEVGATVYVTLSDDAVFSDGTPVTAADCVYSYNLARGSADYASRFTSIRSFSAESDRVFAVVFDSVSRYNVNMLDIPIIKSGSDSGEFPLGAGAFFAEIAPTAENDDGISLYPNIHCRFEDMSGGEKIELREYDSAEELLYAFNYGTVHGIYADLSEGRANYRGNTELSSFTTNRLVFAYANPVSIFFTNYSRACAGISYAIDRQALVSEILDGCAVPAWFPFNPAWEKTVGAELSTDIYSQELAALAFYEARLYMNEGVLEWFAVPAQIRIVVSAAGEVKAEAAERLAEYLNTRGFIASVQALKWEDYERAVAEKDYDILIGEIELPPNMDISPVAAAVGFTYSESMAAALSAFYGGEISMRDFLAVFSEEMPFIPLYYTDGALAVNRALQGQFAPGEDYLFFKVGSWRIV